MREPIVTCEFDTTRGALLRGMVTLPENVTWMVIPNHTRADKWAKLGEFPHAPFCDSPADQCPAFVRLVINRGRIDEESYDPSCTRLYEHDGPHVAHIGRGMPIAAWTDSEVSA